MSPAHYRYRYWDRVVYDEGAIRRLPSLLDRLGHHRVLLVTGKASFEASGAAAMMPDLEQSFAVERWSDFSANTDSADLARGLEVVRSFDPDVVIGIGGGSPMDMAKLIVAYDTVQPDALLDTIRAGATIEQRSRGLVLAATTSGSGSEATHFAVVYIGQDKFSVAGPVLRPDAVVLDPLLAMSGSAHQRATSGVDALCQSIESLWAVAATDESRRYARYGLCLVSRNIRGFVHAPDRATARAMSLGSHLAGRAIDISKTTAAHALSYGITKKYGIDHGNAVALTLGTFIDVHSTGTVGTLRSAVDRDTLQQQVATILRRLDGADTSAAATISQLLSDLGLASSISEADSFDASDADELVDSVNVDRLGNNPFSFDTDELREIVLLSQTGDHR